MLKLIDPLYTKLGFDQQPGDSHLDIKLRKKAVRSELQQISNSLTYTQHIGRSPGPAQWVTRTA